MREAAARGLSPKTLDDSALAELARHDWPGNVRELENLVYRLCPLNSLSTLPGNDVAPLSVRQPAPALVKP